jgi:hypothetical protein
MGFLDLPSPILALLDQGMGFVLPASVRLVVWSAVAALVSMWIYGRSSKQERLAELKPELKAIKKDLASYDGPIAGLWTRMGIMFRLTGQQLWLTFLPAVWSSLPVLFLLAFLSNTYTLHMPQANTVVPVKPDAEKVVRKGKMAWSPEDRVRVDGRERYWLVVWPEEGETMTLNQGNTTLLTLPLDAPVDVVHKKKWWNWLMGNPAGYLPATSRIDEVHITMADRDMFGWGPGWMRFWLTPFLFFIVVFSLALKFVWKLH